LFELVTEEDADYDYQNVEADDLFETLANEYHSENCAVDVCINDTEAPDKEEEQDFSGSGGP
jgi:hypothetical protein